MVHLFVILFTAGFDALSSHISKWNKNHESFQKEGNQVASTALVIATRREKPLISKTYFVPLSHLVE